MIDFTLIDFLIFDLYFQKIQITENNKKSPNQRSLIGSCVFLIF